MSGPGTARPDGSGHTRLATVALLAVTAAWGSTFFMIRDLVQQVPPLDFLGLRFSVAAVAMLALFWRQVRQLTAVQWRHGAVLGVLYASAQILQTYGLAHTSASLSGFITGLYVVLTPLFGAAFLRDRIAAPTWVAVALSLLGLGVIGLGPLGGVSVGVGELLTLAGAAVYALHIIGLGRLSTPEAAAGLAVVQIVTIAVICLGAAAPDGLTLPATGAGWVSVLYMALVAGAFAMWAQTWAQAHLSASRAAVLMTMEPVFAAGFAVVFGGESLTVRIGLGGLLIVAAMYVVELGSRPVVELRPAPP